MKVSRKTKAGVPSKGKKSNDGFMLLFEHNPLPMWVRDHDTFKFLAVNDAAVAAYGYTRAEFLAMHITDIRPPEEAARLIEDLKKERPGLQPSGKGRHRRKDGSVIDVEITSHTIQYEGHKASLVVAQDVTERQGAAERLRESERQYRNIYENAPIGLYRSTPQGRIVLCNPALIRMLGYSSAEEVARLDLEKEFIADYVRSEFRRRLEAEGEIRGLESTWTRQNGSTVVVRESARVIRDADGKVLYYEGTVEDITDRKQADVLQDALYRIARAADHSKSLNELYPQIHNIISEVMPARNFYIAIHDQARNKIRFPYFVDEIDTSMQAEINPGRGLTAYVLRTGKSLLSTGEMHDELERQGEVILMGAPSAIWLGVPLIVSSNTIGVMVVQHYTDTQAYGLREQRVLEFVSSQIAIAIERKRAEEAVQESEQRYRGLFENSPVSLWEEDFSAVKHRMDELKGQGVTDFASFLESHPEIVAECAQQVRVLDVNRATLKLYKAPSKSDLLDNLGRVFAAESYEAFRQEMIMIAEGRSDFEWEGVNLTVPGDRLVLSMHGMAAPGYEDTLAKMLISVTDITERQRAEERLRESERQYRNIYENATIGLYRTSAEGRILMCNPALAGMLGYASCEELLQRDLEHTSHADYSRSEIRRQVENDGEIRGLESTWTRRNGSTVLVRESARAIRDADGKLLYYEGTVEDITERKQAEVLQDAIYRIAQAADQSKSLNALYPQIHHIISEVMPARNFYIALHDPVRNLIRFPYYVDEIDTSTDQEISPSEGLTAYVLRTGKSLLCTQEVHNALIREGHVILIGTPAAIWLGIPLIVYGSTIGVMAVQHYTDPQAYGLREQRVLEFVSSQIAIAIERKRAEEAVQESEQRYRGLFENSPVSLWEEDFSYVKRALDDLKRQGVTDFRAYLEGHPDMVAECAQHVRVLDVNRATLKLYKAKSKSDLLANLVRIFADESYEAFRQELTMIAEGRTEFEWEGVNLTVPGDRMMVSLQGTAAPGYEDTLARVLISVTDVTDRKRAVDKLEYVSTHDALTRLYNRAFFDEAFRRLEQGGQFPVSVVMADVDDLKTINDRDGHAAGDAMLQRTAQVLMAAFRSEDVVARIGGDEFAVLLPRAKSALAVQKLGLIKDLLAAHNRDHPGIPLSISIGTATEGQGSSLSEILKEADDNMYLAKEAKELKGNPERKAED